MNKYIDAVEFRERIDRYPPEIRDLAKKELRYCKTADVAPVKRGHWKEMEVVIGQKTIQEW